MVVLHETNKHALSSLNIIHVIIQFSGGAEIYADSLNNELNKMGYTSSICSMKTFLDQFISSKKLRKGTIINLHSMPTNIRELLIFFKFLNFIKQNRNGLKFVLTVHGLMNLHMAKYILHNPMKIRNLAEGSEIALFSLKLAVWFTLIWSLYKRLINLSSGIVVVTHYDRKVIRSLGFDKQCEVIWGGANDMFFKQKWKTKSIWKKNYPIILFPARLVWYKGISILLRALNIVRHEYPNLLLVITSPEEKLHSGIRRSIVKYNLKNNIFFKHMPYTEMLVKLWSSCDLLVYPSYAEGMPLTISESMALGIPIIATPVGDIPYILKNGQRGIISNLGDHKKLAEEMLNLLSDNEKMYQISRNIRQYASNNLTWNATARKYISFINRMY